MTDEELDPMVLKQERDVAVNALLISEAAVTAAQQENSALLLRCNELETQAEEKALIFARLKSLLTDNEIEIPSDV